MPDLVVSRHVIIPAHELQWRFSRSSGPGGQSVNTTDSRVELSLDVAATIGMSDHLRARALDRLGSRAVDGVVTVVSSEQRSQLRNRQAALERLAQTLREATAPPPPHRRPTKPSRASNTRRLDSKRKHSNLKASRSRRDDE